MINGLTKNIGESMEKKIMSIGIVIVLVLVSVVFYLKNNGFGGDNMNTFKSISQDEAMRLMETEKDYIILDVRTPSEFSDGHIKGAINVPNETITISTTNIPELPNKDQLIFVYCRSGSRSRQAAGKLFGLGYTNLREMGGIMTWKGDIER